MIRKIFLHLSMTFAVLSVGPNSTPTSSDNAPLVLRFLCDNPADLGQDLSIFSRRVQRILKSGYKIEFDGNIARLLFLKKLPTNDQLDEITMSGLIEVFENLTPESTPEIKTQLQYLNSLNLNLSELQKKRQIMEILWDAQAVMRLSPEYYISVDFNYTMDYKFPFKEARELLVYKKPAIFNSKDIEKLELYNNPEMTNNLRPYGLSVTLRDSAAKIMGGYSKSKRGTRLIFHVNGEQESAPALHDPDVSKRFLVSKMARSREYYETIIRIHKYSPYYCEVLTTPQ